jgi:hypothetical protein
VIWPFHSTIISIKKLTFASVKMSFPSLSRTVIGDTDVSRSQLGAGWSGTSGSAALWSLYYAANHYCVDAVADITLTLPPVGFLPSEAQPGHWVTIANKSNFVISIENSSPLLISRISGGSAIKLIADSSAINGWTIEYNTSPKASLRANVDPTSNPDPIINGLLVPAGASEFSVPITVSPQGLGIAESFIYDPLGCFAVDVDTITVQPGRYFAEASLNIISFNPLTNPTEGKIMQFLRTGDVIFGSAPICSDAKMSAYQLTNPPNPLDAFVWTLTASSNFILSTAESLSLRFIPNNTTDVVVSLTSNISLTQL